jgi:hypothetical protein
VTPLSTRQLAGECPGDASGPCDRERPPGPEKLDRGHGSSVGQAKKSAAHREMAPEAGSRDAPTQSPVGIGDHLGSVANSDTVSKIGLMYCQGQLR